MSVWGKVIGGVAGFAVGGPIGAIIGAVAGHHVVDKNKKSGKLDQDDKQVAFTTAVIVLSAKMAKADGRVTRDEVDAFKQLFLTQLWIDKRRNVWPTLTARYCSQPVRRMTSPRGG